MELVVDRVESEIHHAIQGSNASQLSQVYQEQGEFLAIENFLPGPTINQLMTEVEGLRPRLNRNYIPTHKKGGSVSYYLLKNNAPAILSLYRSPAFIEWLNHITGVNLLLCPEDDPHACALYFYTEAGDHIGWHYDTSYYQGARYTVLIGLVDRSTSQLLCRLHTKNSSRQSRELALATNPGLFVLFNGDLLHHAVTPLGEGEERIVLTMQYVTNPQMGAFKRWFSNMKDAVGYFGLPALIRRPNQQ